MLAALRLVIWRVWKWFLHYLTGNCEIYRICLSNLPLTNKIGAVGEFSTWPIIFSYGCHHCSSMSAAVQNKSEKIIINGGKYLQN